MLCVQSSTPDDGETVLNMQSVLFQNKNKLRICASSWFYYRNISRCTVPWTSNVSPPHATLTYWVFYCNIPCLVLEAYKPGSSLLYSFRCTTITPPPSSCFKLFPQHPISSRLLVSTILLSILISHILKTFLLQRKTKDPAYFKQEGGAVIKMISIF